jgi:hypothetical protein
LRLCAVDGIDDVGFIDALLDNLEGDLCIDRRRVHATGMSNGAELAHRLACDLSWRIASITPVAGTDNTTSCAPTRPVPVMHIHGSADQNVPFDGGVGCGLSGVPTRRAGLMALNLATAVGRPTPRLVGGRHLWTQGRCLCEAVVLCTIAGGVLCSGRRAAGSRTSATASFGAQARPSTPAGALELFRPGAHARRAWIRAQAREPVRQCR